MKKPVQILLFSGFLLTFMLTKTINVMQDTKELWKAVPGFEGKVHASTKGRIKTFFTTNPEGKIRKLQKGLRGKYLRVQIRHRQEYYSVHRLVALAWHQNPNNLPIVRHLDDNGLNNFSSNLKWDTQSNNIRSMVRGDGGKRFTEIQKQVIREAFKKGFSKNSIGMYFKVTDTTVRRVVS